MKKPNEKCILVSYIDKDNMKFLKQGERKGINNSIMLNQSIQHFEKLIENRCYGKDTLIAPISKQRTAFLNELKDEGYNLPKIIDVALSYLEKNFDHAMEWEN